MDLLMDGFGHYRKIITCARFCPGSEQDLFRRQVSGPVSITVKFDVDISVTHGPSGGCILPDDVQCQDLFDIQFCQIRGWALSVCGQACPVRQPGNERDEDRVQRFPGHIPKS